MYMSSPGCSPLGPEPVIPAMWKNPFATFMLEQVCGGASATLGDRIVFMHKGPSCEADSKRERMPCRLDLSVQTVRGDCPPNSRAQADRPPRSWSIARITGAR